MIREMKRKPLGTAVPYTILRHSEKTLMRTPDLKETFCFPHDAVYCSSIVFRCARAFTRTSQQVLHKPMGS